MLDKAKRAEHKVVTVLINFDTTNDTIECVRSIADSSVKTFVIIVDNNSKDKITGDQLDFYPDLEIIYSNENVGFGRGNNIGINWALSNLESEYIFLLNNDTTIQPDTIQKLIEPFSSYTRVGLTTCKIMYSHNPKLVWYGGGEINLKTGRLKITDMGDEATAVGANKSRFVTFASGCAMMFKRDVLKETGGFDDKFFMYVEDLDLCLRLEDMGYKIWYTAETLILHKVHGSSNRSEKKLPGMHPDNPNLGFYTYHMVKNTLLTMNKHLNGFYWGRFLFNYMLVMTYKNVTYLFKGRFKGNKAFFNAVTDFIKEK